MPYNKLLFTLDRGTANTNTNSISTSIHTYYDPTEVFSNFSTANYFPPYFGFDSTEIEAGDLIYAQASDNAGIFTITGPSAPSFSFLLTNNLPSIIYTQGSMTFSSTAFPSPIIGTLIYSIINNIATIQLPTISVTASPVNFYPILSTLPSASLYPIQTFYSPIKIYNGTGTPNGYITIDTSGNVTIANYSNAGSGTTLYGFSGTSLSYIVNEIGA